MSRSIHINGQEFPYQLGRGAGVTVFLPSKRKIHISAMKITGLSSWEVEKGIRKRWLEIKPADIKRYMIEHVIPTLNLQDLNVKPSKNPRKNVCVKKRANHERQIRPSR